MMSTAMGCRCRGIRCLPLGVASGLVTAEDGSGSVSLTLGALGPQSGHKVNGATTGCAHLYCTDVSVGAVSVALGAIDYGPGAYTGYLSNWSFRSRDEEYIVSQLLVRGSAGQLEMVLDREPAQSLINGGVLLAGEYGYLFSDAEWNATTKRLTWRDTALSWSSGDEIRVYVDDGSRQSSDHVAARNVGPAGTNIELNASGSSGVKHVAVSVTVGDRPVTVYEVAVSVGIPVDGDKGTQLSLLSDANGPGARLGILDRADHVGAGLLVYDLPSITQPVLNANTTYWFAITVLRESRRQLVVASSAVMDSSASRGWRIGSRTLGSTLTDMPSGPGFWSEFGTNQPLKIEIKASEHVDLLAARLVSVPLSHSTFPDGDTFGRGDRVEVEYTFEAPVTYSSGRASLAIDQTTGLRRSPTAGYISGSGTKKLLYAHEVANYDNDVDGFTIPADSLGSDAPGLRSSRDGGIDASHAEVSTGLKVRGSSTTCDRHACIDVSTADLGGGKIGASPASGSLSRRTFSFAGDPYVVREVASTSSGGLELQLDRKPTELMLSDGALEVHHDTGESVFRFSDAVVDADNRLTWGTGGPSWTASSTVRVDVFTDSAATGAPVVKGIGEVGETLWADVSGIADTDGLSGVEFSYQWKRTPAAIGSSIPGVIDVVSGLTPDAGDTSRATSELYRLVEADRGADVSVEVGFADDLGVRYVVEADEGLTVGARASFLVANLGTAVGADVDGGGSVGGLAQSFSTGTHAAAVLEAVRLRLGVGSGSVSVSVHSDAGAAPGISLQTLRTPSIVDASAATAEEFASTGLALAAGTTYWVVVTADAGTATVSVGSSSVTEEDAAPAAGWSVGDSYSSRSGTAWTAQSATGAAARVLAVGVRGTTIPVVEVQFGAGAYTVSVGSSATVEVSLSADPERTVLIPITVTHRGGVTTADYSGVPTSVTFNPGETSKPFVFVATPDSDHDGGGSVTLSFGTLPAEVTAGTTSQTVIFIIPAAVSNLDATPGDQFVTLNWDDPGNSSITRYQYRYRVTSAEAWNPDWTDIPGSSAATASYTVTGLINNVDYTFEVRVVSDGVEGAEASVATTPIGPPTLPGKPLHLDITGGNEVLAVSWSNGPAEDERAPVTTYEVRYRRVGTASWTTVSRSNDDLSTHQRIPELTNQVAYEVQVRAVNRIGPGAWTTGKGTPQAPPQHAPGPTGDEAFDVGRLGAYWADPDAGGNTLWKESCTGAQSFRIIWNGPEDDTRPVKWAAHVVTRGGAGTVSYKFRKSEGSQGYYEMRGTVTVEGGSSISIRVRGRFGVTWGKWSPPVSLYCFETAQDGDSATPGPLNNVKGASVPARPLKRSRRHLDAQSHNVL